VRSKLLDVLGWFYRLLPALIASGLLLGAVKWLSLHQAAFALIGFAVFLCIYFGFLYLVLIRSERRRAPGIAVVAIETLRSAGRPIPLVGGS
jgi:hypothetical protein